MMINQYDYHANDKDYPDADDGDYYGHDHDHHVYMLMNTYSQLARQSQSPQKQRWQCQRREEAYL